MKMLISTILALAVLFVLASVAKTAFLDSPADLLKERQQIESHLSELAAIVPVSGTGPAGGVFVANGIADPVWIDLEWPSPQTVSEVIVVPMLVVKLEDGRAVSQSWPRKIEILAGDDSLDSVSSRSFSNPEAIRPAPRIFSFPERQTSRIRIRPSDLAPRGRDGKGVFHIAEILVFSGHQNIAEFASIRLSPGLVAQDFPTAYIIDGRLPYELVGSGGGTPAYSKRVTSEQVALTIDFAQPVMAEQIRLFPSARSITVPWRYPPGNGFPSAIRVAASTGPDFADATVLLEQALPQAHSSSPVTLDLESVATRHRYLQLRFGGSPNYRSPENPLCSLAEIQLLEAGENLAEGARIMSISPEHQPKNHAESLFDGKNRFGNLLPLQEWMHQLAQRQALQLELAEIDRQVEHVRERNNRLFHWALIVFICVIALSSLFYVFQIMRLKALALESQELLLAELHDEVGASLHAIRMFAEIASTAPAAKQTEIAEKIHRLAGESAESVRRVTHLLDEGVTGETFIQELERHAKWLPAGVTFALNLDVDDGALAQAPAADLGHLLRFYHECLANVNRHASGATRVAVSFAVKNGSMTLEIEDNGIGLAKPGEVPHSLVRRAKLAGGRVSVRGAEDGTGTAVAIVITHSRW
jgi:signal transduction histidine kinase